MMTCDDKDMTMIETVKEAWGWVGINPTEIITENEFGNLILKDVENKFWRLCPEEVYCEVIAKSIGEYNLLIMNRDFLDDWNMTALVRGALKKLGPLKEGFKYYLAVPGILDGDYSENNIKTASFDKIIRWSGELGNQVKDLPEGAEVELNAID